MFTHVGFGNWLNPERIVAIAVPQSAPILRMLRQAREKGNVVDLTAGRRTLGVVVTDTQVVLVALHPGTVAARVNGRPLIWEGCLP